MLPDVKQVPASLSVPSFSFYLLPHPQKQKACSLVCRRQVLVGKFSWWDTICIIYIWSPRSIWPPSLIFDIPIPAETLSSWAESIITCLNERTLRIPIMYRKLFIFAFMYFEKLGCSGLVVIGAMSAHLKTGRSVIQDTSTARHPGSCAPVLNPAPANLAI